MKYETLKLDNGKITVKYENCLSYPNIKVATVYNSNPFEADMLLRVEGLVPWFSNKTKFLTKK